ncbi:MAG: ATP-binding protein, partial [Bacteroidota bacterium]|nr:ATP-binding protein [Bacteroidota bacterium]
KDGIKIRHDNTISYFQEIFNLMRKIDLGENKIIVLIDEFAQAVENILQDEGEGASIHFLQSNREIRLEPIISTKLQFVYAGSIGLENIVNKINAINTIDDLAPIKVPPLSETEAENFSNKIIGPSITFDNEAFNYLLNKIKWWIPYSFQIILDEAKKNLLEENKELITKETIDKSISEVLEQRIYFELWFTRLRKAYKGEEFSFIKELLNITSEKHRITSSEIYNLAVKFKLDSTYNNLVNTLKYDGYINNNNDPKIYRFNSPLLREWWYRNVAN